MWLLAKLGVQSPSSPLTGSNCQCNVEVSALGQAGGKSGAALLVGEVALCKDPMLLLTLVLPLSTLLTWGAREAAAQPSKTCRPDPSLHPQVVRALTAMLHRQWLTVRRAGGPPRTEQQRRTVRCLRDTVLLLHGLSQKDTLFTVHCVEALHQYDQVMPGVSVLIRGLPDVTDCEGELAGGPLPAPAHLWGFPGISWMSQTSWPCQQPCIHHGLSRHWGHSYLPALVLL